MDKGQTLVLMRQNEKLRKEWQHMILQNWHMQIMENFNAKLKIQDFLFFLRERGRKGEREGEKNQHVVAFCTPLLGIWPAFQECTLTGNRTGDPSTEPHQPGLKIQDFIPRKQ